MSADGRWPGGDPSSQVEDRYPGTERSGFGAGSEGAGSEIWDREPAVSGTPPGWGAARRFATRGGEREQARRRVESNPEAMPPHPMPVDRHEYKPEGAGGRALAKRALPVAGLFLAGLLLPRLFGRRRTFVKTPELVVAFRTKGRRNSEAAARLADLMRDSVLRGDLVFR